jgi:hypothetical protein
MHTQENHEITTARQAVESVLALEAAVRRSVEDLSPKDFRELARMGWEEVQRVAEVVRERLAGQDALCASLERRLENEGAAANPELAALHAELQAALEDFEQRAVYAPYEARLKRMPFPAATPMSDADLDAAWAGRDDAQRRRP